MDINAWIILIIAGSLLFFVLGLSFIRRFSERAAYRFAVSVGIGLSEEFLPLVRSRLILQQRGGSIGGLLVLIAAELFLMNNVELTHSTFGPLAFAGIVIAGMSAGSAVTALRSHSHRDPNQPRLARARVVTLADYVAPLERTGAYVVVALAVATTLTFVAASGVIRAEPLPWLSGPGILAALAVASLVLFEVAGRRILRKGQPAGSPTELAWDDALRSQRLRSLVTAPLILGAYCTFASLASMSMAFTQAGNRPLAVGFATANLAFIATAVVILIIALITRPQRFFLRRLWPDAEGAA
jgi:hypothetical protein